MAWSVSGTLVVMKGEEGKGLSAGVALAVCFTQKGRKHYNQKALGCFLYKINHLSLKLIKCYTIMFYQLDGICLTYNVYYL